MKRESPSGERGEMQNYVVPSSSGCGQLQTQDKYQRYFLSTRYNSIHPDPYTDFLVTGAKISMDRFLHHGDGLQMVFESPIFDEEEHDNDPASCESVEIGKSTQNVATGHDIRPDGSLDPVKRKTSAVSVSVLERCRSDTPRKDDETISTGFDPEGVDVAVMVTDGEEEANTVRSWVLGLLFVTIVAAVNQFLSMRWPVVNIPTVVVVLLVQPIGTLWAKFVPQRRFEMLRRAWSLNPGPFSIKEHAVVALMANVIAGFAYPSDAILALSTKSMYNLDMDWGFQILFTLSSHLIGIGLAGLLRQFLVWPPALIWPANFSTTSLLHALHTHDCIDPAKTNGWRIAKSHCFGYVALASFLWYWLPGVLWKSLSVFSFLTWIQPRNVTLNQLFGGFTGMSLIPLTFDWTVVVSWLHDPLLAPTAAHLNVLVGLLAFIILPSIAISFSGALYSDFLPISSNFIFDNTQNAYDATKILGPDFTFDLEKYKGYSPLFLSPTYLFSRGASFAAITASIVHVALFNKREIGRRIRAESELDKDVHMRMMEKYPEAFNWWYALTLAIAVCLGLVAILAYPSQLPWWAYFASLGIAFSFVLPCCMIYSTTNVMVNLASVSPFLAGFIVPGRPVAVILFEIYSNLVTGKVQVFSQDLKLAHYLKIPPRTTFFCQLAATLWATFVQVATLNWARGAIDQACTPEQQDHFTCPNARSLFSSSIVFGVIGPARIWGSGATYVWFNFCWLFGLLLPVLFYALFRSPSVKRRFGWLNAPVMLGSVAWIPPASPLSYFTWVFVGLIFNYGIRNRFRGWWRGYNYLTAAGMDSGLLISTMVILLGLTLPGVTGPKWWGNEQGLSTLDANGTAIRKTLAPGEVFGPTQW